jgi:uncharacterized phage protein gp47/JayE
MPTPFGVTPTGFSLKRFPEILPEIEADNILSFGSGIIQTPQSPLGQWNAMAASIASRNWELFQDVYQSFDPSQATDVTLDNLGLLAGVTRLTDENDTSFRARIIGGGANEYLNTDALNAIKSVAGVTCAFLYENASDSTDKYGIASHTVAWCVVGGDDIAVANVIESWTENGIGTFGNTAVSVNDVTGVCRTVNILRPKMIPCLLNIVVDSRRDKTNRCKHTHMRFRMRHSEW